MTERRSSRRDLFRLLAGSLADREGDSPREAVSAPATEVPREGGRLVVDLALHPVPVARGRRFRASGGGGAVLVVRVSSDHFAAVEGDCPRCGGPLRYDLDADTVRCPRHPVPYRMDGRPAPGASGPPLRVHHCRAAGPRLEVEPLDPPDSAGKPREPLPPPGEPG